MIAQLRVFSPLAELTERVKRVKAEVGPAENRPIRSSHPDTTWQLLLRNLVWGFRSQVPIFTAFSFFFIPVSLFDLKACFFAPTRSIARLARAGAVKDWRSFSAAVGLSLTGPSTTARLDAVGMTIRGEPASGASDRAATLYSVGREDPNHDALMRIGSVSSEAADPFCTTA